RLQWRIVDLLTHGWDLAQATGVVADLPDDLVEQALTFARAQLPSQPRAGRFADPQPIGDHAPGIDRLAALTRRPVPWTPATGPRPHKNGYRICHHQREGRRPLR